MSIIFFIFRSRYRYGHVGNLFAMRRAGRLRFIPVVGVWAVLLEPLLHYLSCLIGFKLVYTDNEFSSRRGLFRLWWNTPEELGPRDLDRSPLMVCGNPIQTMPRCQFYPVLQTFSRSAPKQSGPLRAIYMSEVELPTDPLVLSAWAIWREALLEDMALITYPDFWDKNFAGQGYAARYVIYRGFNNLIRHACVKVLHDAAVPVTIFGDKWRILGIPSADNLYDAFERRRLYMGNLCLDFGSKAGSDSLYQRTIEIIESGGALIQARRADSAAVYGSELAERMTFRRLADLPDLVIDLLQNPASCEKLQAELQMQFAQNKNLDPQVSYSLAALMGRAL
jgi:hypothetical protein